MIELESISIQRGGKPLLQHADLRIHPGDKVALVGANGSGKSSLFALLRGELDSESGRVAIPAEWRIAHMAQEVPTSQRSALDYVLDGDLALREVESALAAQPDGAELARLHERLDALDGYTAPARAAQLLHGLGFAESDTTRPVNAFSGGWRLRLNLAQCLMCPSDLMLLDEPTNHLDLDATLWLEQWLARYPGTLVLISHDRDFIDALCNQVVHIEQHKLWRYRGHYSDFERQRAERMAQQQAAWEQQQRQREHMQRFIERFRAKATKARQAQSRVKALERMAELAPAHIDSPFTFSFPPPRAQSDPLLNLSQASLGYADAPILGGVNLSVHPGSRIALLGANGAGKSTLLKALAGQLQPLSGQRTEGANLALGYFSQHQLEALDLDASPVQHLQRLSPTTREQSIRDFLGSFNFRGEQADATVAPFSGGEKARLALAIVVWQQPNLLLLDEPTNHLDLDMCQALTQALQDFEGALVLVSHDRHLVRHCADELLLVADGRVEAFDGDLDDYRQWLLSRERTRGDTAVAPASGERKAARQQAANRREQLRPLQQEIRRIERELERQQQALAGIEARLADPALYDAAQKETLQALLREQGTLRGTIEPLEEAWLAAQEQLEGL